MGILERGWVLAEGTHPTHTSGYIGGGLLEPAPITCKETVMVRIQKLRRVRIKHWEVQRLREGIVTSTLGFNIQNRNTFMARHKIHERWGFWKAIVQYDNTCEIINCATGYRHPAHYSIKDDYRNDSWF